MKMTREKMMELYKNNSNKDLCKMLKITEPTLIKYIKELKIPMKGSGNRKLSGRRKLTFEG